MNKKGQLQNLSAGALALVSVAVLVGFGALILAELSADSSITGTSQSVIDNGTEAMATFGKFTPLIALVIVAGVILGIILAVFARR